MNEQVSAAQQLDMLQRQLTQAFVEREDAKAKTEAAEKQITAIRNLMAGVGLGQRLQQEIAPAMPAEVLAQ